MPHALHCLILFQSTIPSQVSTDIRSQLEQQGFISIHDTLAGIDTVGVRPAFAMPHFNPRYPRRYRLQNCTKTFHSISSLSTIYTFFSHITIPSAPYITILSYFLSNISGANLPLIGCALHIRTTQILTHFKPAFNYYP